MNKKLATTYLAHPERDKLLQELAQNLVELMINDGWFKSCLNCSHWIPANTLGPNNSHMPTANDTNFPPETCSKFKVRPPARVIVCGCSEHTDDIPF